MKRWRSRLQRLRRALPRSMDRPCTLFLVEVEPGEWTGWRNLGIGIGAELRFTKGTRPALPDYPVKLVLGKAWEV